MRKVAITTNNYTEIYAVDDTDFNTNHKYRVQGIAPEGFELSDNDVYAKVSFQKGPIKENGVNGCQNEDLIAIVIDRLQGFQNSEFNCRENAIAITKLEEALMWLNKRTTDRKARGVEGTSQK